jgi:UDP-GlcNAc:undecaprenyl-phosphate GlcNAc-1-phosphate transferase
MFVTGLVDDRKALPPAAKLLAQVLATGLLLIGGYSLGSNLPLVLSVPMTFLWVIGITNALNLLDNMDGLAAGIAAIVATILTVFVALGDNPSAAALAASTAGAAAGFLVFNFKPARIFMGDCGSLFLGYLIASIALVAQSSDAATIFGPWTLYLVPLAVMAVPILDTTLVTIMRTMAGRPVSQGGRDHLSHRLVFLGFSERQAVLVLYAVSLTAGGVVLLGRYVSPEVFFSLVSFLGVALAVFGIYLGLANVYGEDGGLLATRLHERALPVRALRGLRMTLGSRWKAAFGLLADLLLIVAAFTSAFHMRFAEGVPAGQLELIQEALPIVVFLKLCVFYVGGLYQGIWRYAGTSELMRVVRATVLSSLLVVVVLYVWKGGGQIARAALLIDWMIVTIAVVAVRFGFRGLHQLLTSQRRGGRRVLLYGAGDSGMLTLRELRQNPNHGLEPVGFIDDDPFKLGQTLQGLRVLGDGRNMPELIHIHQVEEVIISASRMSETRKQIIADECANIGVKCRTFAISFVTMHNAGGDGAFTPIDENRVAMETSFS